jgi:hypothetical protein
MPSLSPSPSTISPTTFRAALALYPALVDRVYAAKLKGDGKKVAEARERDQWRFETLPEDVRARAEGKGKLRLTKAEVERLVVWKM